MVNYYLKQLCPDKQIETIQSGTETDHWRATTAQNAIDVVPVMQAQAP